MQPIDMHALFTSPVILTSESVKKVTVKLFIDITF